MREFVGDGPEEEIAGGVMHAIADNDEIGIFRIRHTENRRSRVTFHNNDAMVDRRRRERSE